MAIVKIKNKIHGYKCDVCRMTPKTVYQTETGFFCPEHAEQRLGKEAVANAEVEED